MKYLSLVLGVVLSAFGPAISVATEIDLSNVAIEKLIDDLTLIDAPAPGIDGMVRYGAFLAEDKPARFEGGVLGVSSPQIQPQMRELVRRGLAALPALIAHLDDNRPTKLTVGADGSNFRFMFRYFSDEYDRRTPPWPKNLCASTCTEQFFSNAYIVRVGDICFALIGQIVNRRLVPVRYQPSAGLVINSPLEAPILIERVRSDWRDLDAAGHRASLLQDVRATDGHWMVGPALARLRYYYPADYQALTGSNLRKRQIFEAEEARQRLQ